jgi:hypothetical protein
MLSGVIALGIGVLGGIGIERWALAPPAILAAAPFNINDARSVLASLRPVAQSGVTSTSVYLWGDGTVSVHVQLLGGADVRGEGNSLAEAVYDLHRESMYLGDQAASVRAATPERAP